MHLSPVWWQFGGASHVFCKHEKFIDFQTNPGASVDLMWNPSSKAKGGILCKSECDSRTQQIKVRNVVTLRRVGWERKAIPYPAIFLFADICEDLELRQRILDIKDEIANHRIHAKTSLTRTRSQNTRRYFRLIRSVQIWVLSSFQVAAGPVCSYVLFCPKLAHWNIICEYIGESVVFWFLMDWAS
jgi:hypothetical protein